MPKTMSEKYDDWGDNDNLRKSPDDYSDGVKAGYEAAKSEYEERLKEAEEILKEREQRLKEAEGVLRFYAEWTNKGNELIMKGELARDYFNDWSEGE